MDPPIILSKRDLEKVLGVEMRTAYRTGIFTDEVVKKLGFSSLQCFKNKKQFTLTESEALTKYLNQLGQR